MGPGVNQFVASDVCLPVASSTAFCPSPIQPILYEVLGRPKAVPSSARIPALDGLRGTAILLVLSYHLAVRLQPDSAAVHWALIATRLTWSGVDLFFVLSGFLIGGILLDARTSPRYYQAFYMRRTCRILPIYALLLGLCLLRYLPFHWLPYSLGSFSANEIPWAAYLLFAQNWWMAHLGNLGLGTLSPTWSLAVEEQFYLTMPCCIKKLTRRSLAMLLGTVVLIAPLLRAFVLHVFKPGAMACYVLMPCRADALCLGVLCAMLVRHRRRWLFVTNNRSLLWAALAVQAALLGILTRMGGDPFSGRWLSIQYSVLACFYTCLLLLVLSMPGGWLARLFTGKLIMRLGTVSYFVYLFHIPLIEISRRLVGAYVRTSTSNGTVVLAYVGGIAMTLVLAGISWTFFEKRMIQLGRTFTY
jgi:peptidoglycan/LPS O-acetylase OafA/YrhL